MSIIESLSKRRSYEKIGSELGVDLIQLEYMIETITESIPDAFNMKSSRVVVLLDKEHRKLWDIIEETFGGQVSKEKIDKFRNAAGTILFFYETKIIEALQKEFPLYAENFPNWASQSSAMLQLSIWIGLHELNLGANLQHYNPVIDDAIKSYFDISESYHLLAQMPFGNILEEPPMKEADYFPSRVRFIR